MIRLLVIAAALLATLSAPAAASVSKLPIKREHGHVNYVAEVHSKWRNKQARTYGDPYWQPCEYFSEDAVNSCD